MLTSTQARVEDLRAQLQLGDLKLPTDLTDPKRNLHGFAERFPAPSGYDRGPLFPDGSVPYSGPFTSCLPAAPVTTPKPSEPELGGDSRRCLFEPRRFDSVEEQITPIFLPGVQDHHTGLRELPAALDLKSRQVTPVGPPPGLEEPEPEVSRHNAKKLENLLVLLLKTTKDDDTSLSRQTTPLDFNSRQSTPVIIKPTEVLAPNPTPVDFSRERAIDEAAQVEAAPKLEEEIMECQPALLEALPPGVVFSCGSVGHPDACNEPCKYARKKRGCKDGLACSRCHLCTWYHKRCSKQDNSNAVDDVEAVVVEADLDEELRLGVLGQPRA